MNIQFRNSGKKEDYKQYIIKYRIKNREQQLPYEIGSAYFHENEWWVNFYDPFKFNAHYEVLAWAEYDY